MIPTPAPLPSATKSHRRYPVGVVSTTPIVRRLVPFVMAGCLLSIPAAVALAQDASPVPSPAPLAVASPDIGTDIAPLAGSWDVVSFDAWGEGLVAPRPDTTLTAAFLPDGRLEGETGCGTYTGGYTLDEHDLGLGIISKGADSCDVPTTEEAVAYSVALEAVTSWQANDGGVDLLDDAGRVRVELMSADALGLVGNWKADGYARANGELLEPLADRPITIAFADDGSVLGSTGCRVLEGAYMSERNRVVIAPVETTGLPCEGDARRQERRLLAVFDAVVSWHRQGTTLVLADGSGAPLLELSATDAPVLPTETAP